MLNDMSDNLKPGEHKVVTNMSVKLFDREFEGAYKPRRIPEVEWFKKWQPVLLWMANTDYGRELLCIDKMYPTIVKMTRNSVHMVLGKTKRGGDFRIGSKWGNVIRRRWKEFIDYAAWYPDKQYMLFLLPRYAGAMAAYLTDYPAPDSDGARTDCDGYHSFISTDTPLWSTMHDETATSSSSDSNASDIFCGIRAHGSTSGHWRDMFRGIFNFDTSSIGSGQTVSAALFSLMITAKADTAFNQGFNLVENTCASDINVVYGEYELFNTTRFCASDVDIGSITTSTTVYNDLWNLDATGIAFVKPTGVTKFGMRCSADIDNAEPSWVAGGNTRCTCIMADTADVTSDPKIFITYDVTGGAAFLPKNQWYG